MDGGKTAAAVRLPVERGFEPHRLRREIETTAYQCLVPIRSRKLSGAASGQSPNRPANQPVKGVAS